MIHNIDKTSVANILLKNTCSQKNVLAKACIQMKGLSFNAPVFDCCFFFFYFFLEISTDRKNVL